jgi:hypothetical protein
LSHKMKRGATCAFSDGHVSTCRSVESIQRCRESHERKLDTDPNYRFFRDMQNERSRRQRSIERYNAMIAQDAMDQEQRRAEMLPAGWIPRACSFGTLWIAPFGSDDESVSTAA